MVRSVSFAGLFGRASLATAALVVASLAIPQQAIAADGDSAQLMLHGTIEPRCAFDTVPTDGDLGALTTGVTRSIGTLSFRCNLAASTAVHLTVTSEHGALQRDGGTETVTYAANWNVQGHSNYVNAASFTSPLGFDLDSGEAGTVQGGDFNIQVTGPTDNLVAGTYRDIITYTISP